MSISSAPGHINQIMNDYERCLVLHSLEGDILAASPKACEELGYTQEEIVQIVLANIKALDLRLSDVCLKHQEDAPVVFQRRNGRRFPAKVTTKATRIVKDRKEQNVVQLEFEIVTDTKQEGGALPKFDLQESVNYLDLLSREIKHPLMKLGLFLDNLKNENLSEAARLKLAAAENYHAELLDLSRDVSDWFKLGTNILHLDRQPFNLVSLTDNLLNEVEPICRDKRCTFSICLDANVNELVFGDVKRVAQLLKRLVLKALVIHQPNQLRMHIGSGKERNQTGDYADLNFSLIVHNYDRDSATQSQGDELTSAHQDSGLGIIGKLIRIMGGHLKQHRRSDVEYEYFYSLAMPAVDTLDLQTKPRFLSGHKVLLIDNDDSLLKYQLMQWGAEVEFFVNWEKAHNYLQQLGNNQPYTLKILQLSHEKEARKIVATLSQQTGATVVMSSDCDCVIDCQQVSHIPWPMRTGLTGNALATVLQKNPPYPYSLNHQSRIVDVRDHRPYILFVDDVETIRMTFYALLEKAQFKVDLAQNGIDAILACDQNRYDLIIIDIQMPYMDGIEAVSHIRNSKNDNRRTPILAVSGDISENSRIAAEKVGIQALHPKSASSDELLQIVGDLVSHSHKQSFTNTAQSPPQNPAPLLKSGRRASENVDSHTSDNNCLNIELLNNLVADTSLEVCTEMVGIFMQESKQSVAIIDEASQQNNWPQVKSEAHAIKSTSYTFGCEALYNIAAQLEEEIERGNFERSASIVDEMAAVYSHSFLALEDFFQTAGKTLSTH